MADFSTKSTDLNAQITPADTITRPVDQTNLITGLNSIAQGVGTAATTWSTFTTNSAVAATNKAHAAMQHQLNLLADSYDQNPSMSISELRTRGRKLMDEAVMNDPNSADSARQIYGGWLSDNGFSRIASDGERYQAIRKTQDEEAVKQGFATENTITNPVAREAAVKNLEAFQTSQNNLKVQLDQIGLENAKLGNDKAKLDAAKETAKLQVTQSVAKIAQTSLPYIQTQFQKLKEEAAKASPAERDKIIADGTAAIKADIANKKAQISATGGAIELLGADGIGQISKPMEDYVNAMADEITGKTTGDIAKVRLDAINNQSALLAMNSFSEGTRRFVALSAISPQIATLMTGQMSASVVEDLSMNDLAARSDSAKPKDLIVDKAHQKGVKDLLGGLSEVIKGVNNNKTIYDKPEDITKLNGEINNQIAAIFKGVKVFGPTAGSPEDFQPIVDFFANPEVGKFVAAHKTELPQEFIAAANESMASGYNEVVLPMLKEEYAQKVLADPTKPGFAEMVFRAAVAVGGAAPAGGSDLYKASDIIEPTFDNGKFSFQLKKQFANSDLGKSPQVKTYMKDINSGNFSKLLNKMVVSSAHMRGDQDYQKSYDALNEKLFGATGSAAIITPTVDTVAPEKFDLSKIATSDNTDVLAELAHAKKGFAESDMGAASMVATLNPTAAAKYGGGEGPIDTSQLNISDKRGYVPDTEHVNKAVMSGFVELQQAFGKQIPIVSGYRDAGRNARAGGAKHSQHIHGNALDLDVSELTRSERIDLIKKARALGFGGIGVYDHSIHIDMGSYRSWGPTHHAGSVPHWARGVLS